MNLTEMFLFAGEIFSFMVVGYAVANNNIPGAFLFLFLGGFMAYITGKEMINNDRKERTTLG